MLCYCYLLLCYCYGIVMLCYVIVMSLLLLQHCYVIVMLCYFYATLRYFYCYVIVMLQLCYCYVIAMLLVSYCYVISMSLLCCQSTYIISYSNLSIHNCPIVFCYLQCFVSLLIYMPLIGTTIMLLYSIVCFRYIMACIISI